MRKIEKLTIEQLEEIKTKYDAGTSAFNLAIEYKRSPAQIYNLLKRGVTLDGSIGSINFSIDTNSNDYKKLASIAEVKLTTVDKLISDQINLLLNPPISIIKEKVQEEYKFEKIIKFIELLQTEEKNQKTCQTCQVCKVDKSVDLDDIDIS